MAVILRIEWINHAYNAIGVYAADASSKPSNFAGSAFCVYLSLWRTTCSSSHSFHKAKDRSTMFSVQQSLCYRFRSPESHAVPCQDRQHLVAVQRHHRTRRTSAAAAAAAAVHLSFSESKRWYWQLVFRVSSKLAIFHYHVCVGVHVFLKMISPIQLTSYVLPRCDFFCVLDGFNGFFLLSHVCLFVFLKFVLRVRVT